MVHESDESLEATALIATVDRLWDGLCHDCRTPYRGHEAVFSIALGFKNSPRCLRCLAKGLKRDPPELRGQLLEYIQRRDCYRQAWDYANRREAANPYDAISCTSAMPDCPIDVLPNTETAVWDAGDMSCGDLVLALRIRLAAMTPGSVLKVIARDPAAPEDLPSWCRLTGHKLISNQHPEYTIQRKEN